MTSSSAPEATRPNLLAEAGVLDAWRSHFETSQRLVGLLDAELRKRLARELVPVARTRRRRRAR